MRTYFMGIGGLAMGNVALLAKQLGDTVIGSDTIMYGPMREALSDCEIYNSYSAERLSKLKPDTVVIGNAIGRGNPELEWFWETKPFAYYSMPEFLYEKVLSHRKTIAVCGTHGKTTTTTLAAYLLKNNNVNTGWLIGGVPQDLPSGANAGVEGGTFVIEGDEYDSAFFDKRAKFISYAPTVAVLNNLEIDHLDIYRDIEDLKRAFNHLLRTLPRNGVVIANADDANLRAILPVSWVPVLWVSAQGNPMAQLQITNFSETVEGSTFTLSYNGKKWTDVAWHLPGIFNARNAAMAAIAAGWSINPQNPTVLSLSSLADFQGVKRRQEIRHSTDSLVVVEDFAHHPTAVEMTLTSLKARYPGRKWVSCLEPRSNTSRTNAHQATMPGAMALADVSLWAPIFHAESIPAEKRFNLDKAIAEIQKLGKESYALSSYDQLPAKVTEITSRKGPWGVVFFSNGNFEGAFDRYMQSLQTTTV